MHSRSQEPDELYPVLADEPVEVRRPRRKVRLIAASFAATIVLAGGAAYAGTAYAIDRADSDLRHSRDQFAADLAERRREQLRQQAEMNKDLCTVVIRLPADPETDALRRRYGCGPFVAAAPASGSAPSPGAPPPPKARTSPTAPAGRPRTESTRPAAAPTPPPGPPAPPADDPGGGPLGVCLPLLGCVVL
ncbi:MAG: hypothetical protein AUI10_07865 [Actinobacteria bacterium 13_2_20CM_2_72_6]|nr:MAG: hypothetical protein AUI10_07865 [Actinobacteria bacterium 13_2_20CM_2_72_6]